MVNESLEKEIWIDEYAQALELSRTAPAALADASVPTAVPTTKFYVLQSPALDVLYTHLFQATPHLLRIEDYPELLQAGLQHALWLLPDFTVAVIWLYEQRTGRLALAAYTGLDLNEQETGWLRSCQIYPGESPAGVAFQRNELTLSINHTPQSDELREELAAISRIRQNYLPPSVLSLCIPLRLPDEKAALGILELVCTQVQGAPISDALSCELLPELRAAVTSYSQLLATAIHNKRLYDRSERHCRRLDGFDAVVTAISTATDLPDLLRSVLGVVIGLQPFTGGAILLLDPAQARLTLGYAENLPESYCTAVQAFPVSGSAFEEVVRYGQPALRPLIEERCEAQLVAAGYESGMYLPLLAGGTVVGVLALFGDANMYHQVEMPYLMPLMNQIGFAIANVRLYEESQIERQRLSTVINSIAEGVVVLDRQGRLVLANEAAMELLSLDAIPYQQPMNEMPDFYAIRDLSGAPLPVEQLPMARALSGETFYDYRVLLRGASGQNSVMSFSGSPARANQQQPIDGAVVVFRDITALQRIERAKDEFLAVAAHELRSPLAAVRGYTEQLLRRERDRPERDERDLRGLTILSEEVAHMLRMVDNLLDVSRLDAGQLDLQLQQVDVIQLVQRVLDQQRVTASAREVLLYTTCTELFVLCDELRIRQVLTNLIGNALKYSPPGTSVEVRIAVQDGPRSTSEATAEPQREVLFAISDAGNGIEPELQARLFERFYRVKNRREEGLGLGLYLSREFVLLHGGRIWVDSTVGKGSTFSFTLPLRSDELRP